MRRICLLVAVVVLLSLSTHVAASYGKIVYALTVDKLSCGKANVYEKDLDSGKAEVLIPHDAFPKEFRGSVDYLDISPNGRHLMVGEVIEAAEGKSDTDSSYTSRLWIWTRESKSFRLAMAEADGALMGWSSGGDLFGVRSEKTLSLYSLSSEEVRTISMPRRSTVSWSARDDRVIAVWAGDDDYIVYEQLLDGSRPRRLFHTWSPEIAEAPDRSVYAVGIGDTVDFVNRQGRRVRRTGITAGEDFSCIDDLCFGPSSQRLAVIVACSYGEPRIHDIQQLWSVDVKTGRSVKLETWEGSQALPFWTGDIGWIEHYVAGWSSDEKYVLVGGEVRWDAPEGIRNDRQQIRVYAVGDPKDDGRELFDSGQGCTGFTWWRGS